MTARSRLLEIADGRRTIELLEAGDGDPLVFLHGAGGLAADSRFLAALARGRHVLAPLLPGYGRSSGADSLRDMLAVTLHSFDVLDALGLDRPTLVGHSMGGMIAAEMAALAPREVERLGLIAPMGLWLDAHPLPDLFSMLPRELPGLLFHDPEFGERMLTGGLDLADPKVLEAFVVGHARQLAMASKLLFPLPDRGLAERLYRVRAKTLVIWGEDDRLVPPAYGQAFCRGIAGAELVTVPAAGHMIIDERPEVVVTVLARLDRE
jgi:pimeloyl-ACP methyl ester carboxylesterase